MDSLIDSINKEFGEGSVVKFDTKPLDVEVISTGSFSLDRATGVGGLPKGAIVEIFGPEAGGKTTIALSVIAQSQKEGGNAVYIDAENSLHVNYLNRLGVDEKKLIINQPSNGEEALNIAERFIKSGKVDVIVIDSVAMLEPTEEAEADIGKQTMGLKARMMSQAFRKLSPIIRKTGTLAIFINQVRASLGNAGYGNPETTPGGKALKFAASMRIDVRRISHIKQGEKIVGAAVRTKVVKNRYAPPYGQGTIWLMFDKGISLAADVFNIGVEEEVIKKTGNTYLFGKEKIGVGLLGSINALEENKSLLESIMKTLKEKPKETDEQRD